MKIGKTIIEYIQRIPPFGYGLLTGSSGSLAIESFTKGDYIAGAVESALSLLSICGAMVSQTAGYKKIASQNVRILDLERDLDKSYVQARGYRKTIEDLEQKAD